MCHSSRRASLFPYSHPYPARVLAIRHTSDHDRKGVKPYKHTQHRTLREFGNDSSCIKLLVQIKSIFWLYREILSGRINHKVCRGGACPSRNIVESVKMIFIYGSCRGQLIVDRLKSYMNGQRSVQREGQAASPTNRENDSNYLKLLEHI